MNIYILYMADVPPFNYFSIAGSLVVNLRFFTIINNIEIETIFFLHVHIAL